MKKAVKIIAIVLAAAIVIGGIIFAVVKFGKSEENNAISATVVYKELTLGDSLFDNINQSPSRWENILKNSYGMDDETARNLIDHPEDWLAFYLFVDYTNTSDEQVLIDGFDISDNGKNGIYFETTTDMTIIDAGATTELCIYVFVNDNEPSLDEVYTMIKDYDIEVLYSAVPEDLDASIPESDIYKVQVSE